MPEVTIDTDDLEALLFAAGAANASPEAKKILKRDPQFEQVESRLTGACKNAGDAWRKSKRAEEWPERFKVDEHEIRFLKVLVSQGAGRRMGIMEEVPIARSYITKGLVELGIYSESVTWSNSGTDHFQHQERRVRITNDAAQILANSAFDVGRTAEAEAQARDKADKFPGTHKFGFGMHCAACGVSRHDVEDCIASKVCNPAPAGDVDRSLSLGDRIPTTSMIDDKR